MGATLSHVMHVAQPGRGLGLSAPVFRTCVGWRRVGTMAFPALAAPIRTQAEVRSGKRMAAQAEQLHCVAPCGGDGTAKRVLLRGDHLQMGGVYAPGNTAEMVELHPIGNWAVGLGKRPTVSADAPSSRFELPVSVTGASPYPAIAGLINLRPKTIFGRLVTHLGYLRGVTRTAALTARPLSIIPAGGSR